MSNIYTIFVHGIDVTDYFKDLPVLVTRRGEIGALTEMGNLSLVADNTSGVWTVGGAKSMFGDKIQDKPIQIFERDQVIYDGIVRNVDVTNYGRTATVNASTKISDVIEKIIAGHFDSTFTLAELSQRLFDTFGVDTNAESYANAITKQTTLGLQARPQILHASNTSLIAAQEWLAKFGFCRLYFIGSTAYMDFVDPDATHYPYVTFTDEDILDVSVNREREVIEYDGYSVNTATGLAPKSGANPLPSLDVSSTQSFVFPGVGQGLAYGDRAITMSKRNLHDLTIHLVKKSAVWITLQSEFQLIKTSNRLELDKTFEVLSIDNSNLLSTIVEAVSV